MANAGTTNCGIYLITVDRSEHGKFPKFYIGQSVNIPNRKIKHLSLLRSDRHKNPALQAAWKKYGEGAFSFTVLQICNPIELSKMEAEWVSTYFDRHGPRRLFNMRHLFGSPFWHDPKTCERRSQRRRDLWKDEDFRSKTIAGQIKAQNRPEVKAKASLTQKALHNTAEMKAKHRAAQVEAQNRPEVKAKKSASIRAVLSSEQSKRKRQMTNARPEVKARRIAAAKAWRINRLEASVDG